MPELWAAQDAVNRKLRELYARDPDAVNRKLRELWAKDSSAVNRKIFSGYDVQVGLNAGSPPPGMFADAGLTGDNRISLQVGFSAGTATDEYSAIATFDFPNPISYDPGTPLFDIAAGYLYRPMAVFDATHLRIRAGDGTGLQYIDPLPTSSSQRAITIYPASSGTTTRFTVELYGHGKASSSMAYDIFFDTGTDYKICGKQINRVEIV